MKLSRPEKLGCGITALLVVVSMGWFGWQAVSGGHEKFVMSAMPLSGDYQATANTDSETKEDGAHWPSPKAMARGKDWIYDIFTPPEIFYDAAKGKFLLTPPKFEEVASPELAPSMGLELIAVERQPFPLQLVGYVGEPGHYWGTFENRVTFETQLLQTNDVVESVHLKVVSLEVKRVAQKIPDSMTVHESRVTATVRDDRTGKMTVLNQGEIAYTDVLTARVRATGEGHDIQEVSEGDVLDFGPTRFRIEKIRLAPPQVDVSKEISAPHVSESHTLTPLPTDLSPAP